MRQSWLQHKVHKLPGWVDLTTPTFPTPYPPYKQVKTEAEIEQAQRVTQDKKHAVHEELLHKAAVKQADAEAEAERNRRIEESKDEHSEINVKRRQTYDRLIMVQEDLLKTMQRMKVRGERERERERVLTQYH